eukprot:TRINITY_DN23347_c0_g1_i1.p1 TRINITY_DN23347_c0_g1~~TRINITY_DN23347_c0_g1_i1.p1  ORF type:complete len:572 (+),score=124.07 TRINITY_DN23347_c0_g1_i1:185-1717(+)
MSKNCFVCQSKFGIMSRKNHCRFCGYVVCSDCSVSRKVIDSSNGNSRICNNCELALMRVAEKKFCEDADNLIKISNSSGSETDEDIEDLDEKSSSELGDLASADLFTSEDLLDIPEKLPSIPDIDYLNCSFANSYHTEKLIKMPRLDSKRGSIMESLAVLKEIQKQLEHELSDKAVSPDNLEQFLQSWLDSESEFCAHLRVLIDVFVIPMRLYYTGQVPGVPSRFFTKTKKSKGERKRSVLQLACLLDCLEQIFKFHSSLQKFLNDECADAVVAIKTHLPLLSCLYTQLHRFSSNLKDEQGIMELGPETERFVRILEKSQRCKGKSFEWFVSIVGDRLTQYRTMLTSSMNAEITEMFQAHLKHAEISIDQENDREEKEDQMVALARRFNSVDILKYGRILLIEGDVVTETTVTELDETTTKITKSFLYLLSDAAVICNTANALGNKTIREVIELENSTYACQTTASRIQDSSSPLLCIEIPERQTLHKIYPFYQGSSDEEWMEAFSYVAQ